METALDSETKANGPNADKKFENVSDDEANATQNLVTSESKTPLKTPLKEGDGDVQVKFIVNDSANGDAKIDIDNVKSAFAGMAKEELMKYANDPFWIRTRLLLFIFFWAVWIAMFLGAIGIIVMAPRCEAPKRPAWFQEGPLYEVDVKGFVNNPSSKNLLQELILKLDYLVSLKIKGLILNPIFQSIGDDESIVDFKSLNEGYGSVEDLKDLAKESKSKGIHLVMSFVPNHSSDKHPWFNRSIANEEPYDKYYVWKEASGLDGSGAKIPPNNWKSLNGGSAWTWNEQRQAFYLHQFKEDQPDLNFHNPAVLKELNSTLSFWLDLGISGFNLDKAQYLLEDPNFGNETVGNNPGYFHTDYGWYDHSQTYNRPQVANILSSWRDTIRQKTNNEGVLIITGEAPIPADSNENTTIVDLSRSEKLTSTLKPNFTAHELYSKLERILNSSKISKSWPTIQFGGKDGRVADVYGEEHVDGLNMISTILPATVFMYYGEESGISQKNSFNGSNGVTDEKVEESHEKIYQTLVKEKGEEALLYGHCNLTVLNDSVLAVTRIKRGSPGYLVIYNPSPHNVTINLDDIDHVPEELTVLAKSLNYNLEDIEVKVKGKGKIKSKDFTLTPKSSLAFTFVPQMEE